VPPMRRVLAVDDDPSILAVIKDILTRSGYTVDVVPNGVEALRRLEVDTFDIVITDLRMPEMSGPELIVQMQKDTTYSKIPIVILATGAESADLGRLTVDAGLQAVRPQDPAQRGRRPHRLTPSHGRRTASHAACRAQELHHAARS
jgi:CheY-like chemotaxis protein